MLRTWIGNQQNTTFKASLSAEGDVEVLDGKYARRDGGMR